MTEDAVPPIDHKTPVDKVLDLLVYGPAGLALTAAEEFPNLVRKGRHRVDGQVHAARLVGQFAVQMGRRQVESMVGGLFPSSPASPPTPAPGAGTGHAAHSAETAPFESAPRAVAYSESDNGALASDVLGIPGYDSLSASQVVQRLGGLSATELAAIRDHELAHRHRQTILNRVEQLLGAESGGD